MKTLANLLNTIPQTGTLEWIGLRPERRKAMSVVDQVTVNPQTGLAGDRYAGKSGKRQVTLIQAEHLQVVASCLHQLDIDPALTRRNLVVRGVNLLAMKDKIINIGNVQLQITGICHPCSRMEDEFGPGGYNAMRGHGGLTAMVLNDGIFRIGDSVYFEQTLTGDG